MKKKINEQYNYIFCEFFFKVKSIIFHKIITYTVYNHKNKIWKYFEDDYRFEKKSTRALFRGVTNYFCGFGIPFFCCLARTHWHLTTRDDCRHLWKVAATFFWSVTFLPNGKKLTLRVDFCYDFCFEHTYF